MKPLGRPSFLGWPLAALGLAAAVAWAALALRPQTRTVPAPSPVPAAGPLSIPRQMRPGEAAATVPPADELAARTAWAEVRAALRSGADRGRAEALLGELWQHWPGTEAAVESQFFAAAAGPVPAPGDPPPLALDAFVDRALRFPAVYFSERFQAGSQRLAGEAVRQLAAADRAPEAWNLCLRLRWLAPRLDRIAPACRQLAAGHPEVKLAAEAVAALLPPPATLFTFDPAPDSAAAVRSYLADPYDPESLARLLVVLWKAGQEGPAVVLRQELLELDPETLWRLETDARPYGSARPFFGLSFVPWRD